jgi:hypothetical protein
MGLCRSPDAFVSEPESDVIPKANAKRVRIRPRLYPGAELKIMEGMGHDLPHGKAWTQIAEYIIAHTEKASAKRSSPAP